MLRINGKTFMNIQEAVQWLLDNNALPFQCTANYAGNTEIGMGTIVNPSPAKVRIGSLIFFADSKVSTVVGITENGFICSDQYNNLVDDIAYVTNVAINASGHLITTLSDGQTIDAGIVKQVSGFSINASQHLVVSFNDGSSTDLGAIFSGNVNIAGNLTADSIIENMSGYSASADANSNYSITTNYIGMVKNGNKLTLGFSLNIERTGTGASNIKCYTLNIPTAVGSKLFTAQIGTDTAFLSTQKVGAFKSLAESADVVAAIRKYSNAQLWLNLIGVQNLELNVNYFIRFDVTYLLSDSLI